MAKRADESGHDRLVEVLAYACNDKFPVVHADHVEGYKQPDKIVDHIPDVSVLFYDSSLKSFASIIYEVETEDSIADDHTASQWTEFSNWAAERPTRGFIIAVPKGCVALARAQATLLNITYNGIIELD
jgi:hypothetical protein